MHEQHAIVFALNVPESPNNLAQRVEIFHTTSNPGGTTRPPRVVHQL